MHWICTLILILHLYEKLGNRRHQTLPSVLPLVSYFEHTPYARRLYLAIIFKREVNYYTRSTLRIATCQSLTKPQWSLDMWFLKYARWNRGVDGHTDTLIAILRTSRWGEVISISRLIYSAWTKTDSVDGRKDSQPILPYYSAYSVQIKSKSNMTLIMVDKPQPSYNLLNVMK